MQGLSTSSVVLCITSLAKLKRDRVTIFFSKDEERNGQDGFPSQILLSFEEHETRFVHEM